MQLQDLPLTYYFSIWYCVYSYLFLLSSFIVNSLFKLV